MGLEDIVVDHGDILPAGDVARLHLFDIAELAEDLIGFILKLEHSHAVVVECCIAQFSIHTGFDDGYDLFSQLMAGILAAWHKAAPVKGSGMLKKSALTHNAISMLIVADANGPADTFAYRLYEFERNHVAACRAQF